MNTYSVRYSALAVQDLEDIFSYINFGLKEYDTAKNQINRIRAAVKELSVMPNRFPSVEIEPFASMGVRKMSVDKYIVFYQVEESVRAVTVIRVFYGGRDIENLI